MKKTLRTIGQVVFFAVTLPIGIIFWSEAYRTGDLKIPVLSNPFSAWWMFSRFVWGFGFEIDKGGKDDNV